MKHIKTFEAIIYDYDFKIGDYVTSDNGITIYKIVDINVNDPFQPYIISNGEYHYPHSGFGFRLVPEYEIDANKYNL